MHAETLKFECRNYFELKSVSRCNLLGASSALTVFGYPSAPLALGSGFFFFFSKAVYQAAAAAAILEPLCKAIV